MNQSVSVKNLTFLLSLPKKSRRASADSVFSFRHSAYTQGKGVKDWLIIWIFVGNIFYWYKDVENFGVSFNKIFCIAEEN